MLIIIAATCKMILFVKGASDHHFHLQIAYSLIEEQEGKKRAHDVYISFVSLLGETAAVGRPPPLLRPPRALGGGEAMG